MSIFFGIAHDARDAFRAALRAPTVPLIIVATLALGVGVNTAIFSVVDALLFKALPYADADRLVRVAEWPRTGGNFTVAPWAYLAWKPRAASFDALAVRVSGPAVLMTGVEPEEFSGARVSPGYFDLLGVTPAIGRAFVADDALPGAACKVVVSHQIWSTRLDGDIGAVGRSLKVNGEACTLLGVLPADSVFDRGAPAIYLPFIFTADVSADNGRYLTVLGRLRPGVSVDQARTEMVALSTAVNQDRGRAGEGWTATVTPWRDVVVRADTQRLAWTLFAAVAVVLLVACVNVAGLSLARSMERRRDLAVKVALGASRWRAFRGLIVESLMLAAAGEALALLVGAATLRVLRSLLPAGTLPPEAVAAIDGRSLLFASVVSIGAALVFGTAPAWRGTRADPSTALRTEGRSATGTRGAGRVHAALLVAEIALAMTLVTGATLLAISFNRLVAVDPGFTTAGVLTFKLSATSQRYTSDGQIAELYSRVLDRLRQTSGIASAAAVTSLPLGGWLYGTPFSIDGLPQSGLRPSAHLQVISDDYFKTLGIPLNRGRDFTVRDDGPAPLVVIVNETFVKKFLPGGSDVGRHVTMDIPVGDRPAPTSWEIVGVIRNVKTGGLAEADLTVPEIYTPFRQTPVAGLFLAVKTRAADPAAVIPSVRAALHAVDPELPVGDMLTMAQRLGVSVRMQRLRTGLIGAFALVAALLACVGVYGVRSRAVAARRREMGIRLAMGATRGQVVRLVVGQSLALIGIGLAIGLAGAVVVARSLQQWLFATGLADPSIVLTAVVLLGGAALLASWAPARRAGRVNPLSVLRDD
jgi:putative ABC transport system permease protein